MSSYLKQSENKINTCELTIEPYSKPRMTKSDAWKNRPVVLGYWQYADELRKQWGDRSMPHQVDLTFVIPMPQSWGKKKRLSMDGLPHQQTPDIDNLVKAFFDPLLKNDSVIWEVRARKLWGVEGKIIFRSIDR